MRLSGERVGAPGGGGEAPAAEKNAFRAPATVPGGAQPRRVVCLAQDLARAQHCARSLTRTL